MLVRIMDAVEGSCRLSIVTAVEYPIVWIYHHLFGLFPIVDYQNISKNILVRVFGVSAGYVTKSHTFYHFF